METNRIRRGGLQTPDRYLFELSADHPVLDFANTLDLRAEPEMRELLTTYDRLADWTEQSGVLSSAEVTALRREARRHPRRATAALRHAIEVRETIFDVFHPVASRQPIPAAALQRFERAARDAMSRRTLVANGSAVEWQWRPRARGLDRVLWPLLLASGDLLTSPRLARVRVCDGDPCEWLFLDQSQKGNRRWCDMSVCGNREKARRHYERVRGAR